MPESQKITEKKQRLRKPVAEQLFHRRQVVNRKRLLPVIAVQTELVIIGAG